MAGRCRDFGIFTAHDPGNRHRAFPVADKDIACFKLSFNTIKGTEYGGALCTAHLNLSAFQAFIIKGVKRLAEFEHDIVGNIDQGVANFAFSPDSRWLAYFSCLGSPSCQVHVLDLGTGERRSYQSSEFYPFFVDWSTDGNSLAMVSMGLSTPPTYRMLVLDLNTGEYTYAAEYDAQTGDIPSNSPTIAWGLDLPRQGDIDLGCIRP